MLCSSVCLRGKLRPVSVLLLLLFCCSLFGTVAGAYDSDSAVESAYADSDDRIHFISLGGAGADAILIESNSTYMLVDAGNPDAETGGNYFTDDTSNGNAVVAYLQDRGIDHLDYIVITHNHSDHMGGIPTLCRNGLVDNRTTVYFRSARLTDEDFTTDWQNIWYLQRGLDALFNAQANIVCLADENITEMSLSVGDFFIDFRNLDEDRDGITDFHVDDENRNSIVLKVSKGAVSTLLAADLGGLEEAALVRNDGLEDIDILKLNHHGSRTSNSALWLNAIDPSVTVLTKGAWSTGEYSGLGTYAYLTEKDIPVYACDETKRAIVFTITEADYTCTEVTNAFTETTPVRLAQEVPDGYYYWNWSYMLRDNTLLIEDGSIVRNAVRTDAYGYTYAFHADGIGTPE